MISYFRKQLLFESAIYFACIFYYVTLDWASAETNIFYFGVGCLILVSAFLHMASGIHSISFTHIIQRQHSPKLFYSVTIFEIMVAVTFLFLSMLAHSEYRGGIHSTVYDAYLKYVENQNGE